MGLDLFFDTDEPTMTNKKKFNTYCVVWAGVGGDVSGGAITTANAGVSKRYLTGIELLQKDVVAEEAAFAKAVSGAKAPRPAGNAIAGQLDMKALVSIAGVIDRKIEEHTPRPGAGPASGGSALQVGIGAMLDAIVPSFDYRAYTGKKRAWLANEEALQLVVENVNAELRLRDERLEDTMPLDHAAFQGEDRAESARSALSFAAPCAITQKTRSVSSRKGAAELQCHSEPGVIVIGGQKPRSHEVNQRNECAEREPRRP